MAVKKAAPGTPNDYLRRLADAADARGLEIVSVDGDGRKASDPIGYLLVLMPNEQARDRLSGSVRVAIRAIDLLGNLEALPSFRIDDV